ncbi:MULTISPECIES: TusE/DsrC/DsvC family sulfur relay protein [Pseudoalteromonas]|uniref:TusE/DsrC/DsvC family sulfur relay protein n=1 Tax=Pseudoalteromonas TaxID=53246 RepID=UPI0002F119F7|nr:MULTISPECIES: TusE/DsrC/DsvC family sulfur relay protein [Pseudoalteromonas]MCF6142794.1 tRNA 2-thiouridine synthesizing protein E [Pseudoalteromonas mariniglutinosa NCIMB 1770]TMN72361.1 sulfurtransferase TusE [Pseudoalteromonas sp. S1727]BDF94460.1 sulfurtransferase TusE [Pseudoalteromonas sp. KAN5]
MLEFNNKIIDTDKQGYLLDHLLWSEELAPIIAAQESIELTSQHWEVIHFVRNFYLEYNTSPAIRMLVKAMAKALGEDKGNSIYLYKLFPKGPAKQATKIAGLPKPARCI